MQAYSRVVLLVLATAVASVSAIQCGPPNGNGVTCQQNQNCRMSPGQNGVGYSWSCSIDACGSTALCPFTAPICDLTGSAPTCSLGPGTGGLTGGFFPNLPDFATGGFGSSCTTNTDCTISGFSCLGGFCIPGANAACSSTCPSGTSCKYGVCVPGPTATCDPACTGSNVCLFGQCLPPRSTCDPACASGSVCGPFGCIPTEATTCSPACPSPFTCAAGKCVPSAPTCSPACTAPQVCGPDVAQLSAGVNPFAANAGAAASISFKCLSPPGSGNTATCNPTCNSATQVCALGTCINKPPFPIGSGANDVPQVALDALVSGSINVANLPNPSAAPAGGAAASFTGNAFAQVAASASLTYPSMSFAPSSGQPAVGAGAQGAFSVGAGATVNTAAFTASLPNLGVVVNGGANFACATANIAFNATVTYSFAVAAAGQQAAVVALGALDLSGNIMVSGGGRFQFPLDPARVTVGANSGPVQFSAGSSVSGNAAGAAIQINSGVAGSATVNVGATPFTTAGNVLGSSGTLQVDGQFAFAGTSIQPLVSIGATGSMTINGTACQTGDVNIAAGGSLTVRAQGRGVRLGVLRGCPSGATIEYHASGSFAAGTASSGTVFNFAAGTSSTAFACGVRIIDETGATATLSVRSSPRTASVFGNIFAQSGEATFTATSLTYSGAQSDSAAHSFAPVHAVVAAVTLIAVAVARRLF